MNEGRIQIRGLKVRARIGVPDEERAEPQELAVDVTMAVDRAFSEMDDEIAATVDYHEVCLGIERLAAAGERRLVETLADEIADLALESTVVTRVWVTIRKFVLAQTEWVGVELEKSR